MPSLLQTVAIRSAITTSQALAFGSNVAANSLKLCYVVIESGTAATIGASDNNGGTAYGLDSVHNPGGPYSAAITSWPGAIAGPTTVTVTSSVSARINIILEEWSGILASTPFDQHAETHGTSNSASSGGTPAIAQGNELVVGLVGASGFPTFGAGVGFTLSSVAGTVMASENQILTSGSGGQTATFGLSASQPWVCCCATYKSTGTASQIPWLYHRKNVLYFI